MNSATRGKVRPCQGCDASLTLKTAGGIFHSPWGSCALCPTCFRRANSDGIFARLVSGALSIGHTLPGITKRFAAIGQPLPVTPAERARFKACQAHGGTA